MHNLLKPSAYAAGTCAILVVILMGVRATISPGASLDSNLLLILISLFSIFWLLGFVFSWLSLLFLVPLSNSIPRKLSLTLFALVGFIIPIIPGYLTIGLGHFSHGVGELIPLGLIGLVTSLTAWWHLNDN